MSLERINNSKDVLSDLTPHLEAMRQGLELGDYPEYPSFDKRLILGPNEIERAFNGVLILRDGEWEVNLKGTKYDFPDRPAQLNFNKMGFETDAVGRPIHPWFYQMVSDPNIGVVTGKGFYWDWGPNKTADSIVINEEQGIKKVLLIRRKDTGSWALPGGFVDKEEDSLDAAFRELKEETGLVLGYAARPQCIYRGPVADIRTTANAWAETTAFLMKLAPDSQAFVEGGDDADSAAWISLDTAFKEPVLFGSHKYLLQQAVGELK
jgi:ADP-ribose pyrophosphatase YjhB (NUDIX family)